MLKKIDVLLINVVTLILFIVLLALELAEAHYLLGSVFALLG